MCDVSGGREDHVLTKATEDPIAKVFNILVVQMWNKGREFILYTQDNTPEDASLGDLCLKSSFI